MRFELPQKHMNLRSLAEAGLQAMVFLSLCVLWINMHRGSFALMPNDSGAYSKEFETKDLVFSVRQDKHGIMTIRYEPARNWPIYIIPIIIGFGMATATYRQRQARLAEIRLFEEVKAHPLYGRFKQENPEENFFRKAKTTRSFVAWLRRQEQPDLAAEKQESDRGRDE